MKALREQLNDLLEQSLTSTIPGVPGANGLRPSVSPEDPEIDALVAVALQLQEAPQLRVDTDFADMLERRMLRHTLEHRQKVSRGWPFFRFVRIHPALVITASLCLVLLLLGIGTLAIAAQTTNPNNPLYAIKQWEQQVQYRFATSSDNQAALDLQFARDRLQALSYLTDQAHTGGYAQALSQFDEQLTRAVSAINALPAGARQTLLAGQLRALQSEARQKLHGWLPKLDTIARVATTTELGRLGEQILVLRNAVLVLPEHPGGTATIRIEGVGIQPGAQLLVDGRYVQVSGTIQGGQVVFVLPWNGNQHAHSLGVLNPDGTAAQTSSVSIETARENGDGNGNKNNSDGNKNGNENSKGNGKPGVTPTPHSMAYLGRLPLPGVQLLTRSLNLGMPPTAPSV